MKRSAVLFLTGLTLLAGLADARGRSGGGFGGGRSSSYSSPSRGGSYSSPGYSSPGYSSPRYTPPRYTPPAPSYTPRNNPGRGSYGSSTYSAPRPSTSAPATVTSGAGGQTPSSRTTSSQTTSSRTTSSRTPSSAQRTTSKVYPSNSSVRNNPLNTAATAKVTPSQLGNWNKVKLPAGVPRSAVTYSAAPSTQYRYQLQPGRYYPYPQGYYRQHHIGYDILKYAVIFTAVNSVANAASPQIVNNYNNYNSYNPNQGDLSGISITSTQAAVTGQSRGPNLWNYAGVGFLAAAAAWFLMGRRR